MNSNSMTGRRALVSLAAVATFLGGTGAAVAGAAGRDESDDGRVAALDADVVVDSARARAQILAVVSLMPAGWPATEVMRREAGQPAGDAAVMARWRRDAARMPAGWPATESMLAAIDAR